MLCCCASGDNTATERVALEPVVKDEPMVQEEVVEEEPKPKFSVMIVGARGIRNTDWLPGTGKPDCYCEVKCGDKDLYKTKTIDNCMVPRWLEEFEVWEFEETSKLEFKVYDKDLVGSDYLGKVVLTADSFMGKGCNADFPMLEAGNNVKAYLGVKIKMTDQEDYPVGPPPEFEVTVEMGGGNKDYGLDVDAQDMKNLQVCEVDNVGAFKKYNDQNDPSVQVIKSDFIVSVNSKAESQEMVKEFKEPKVNVKLVRALDVAVLLENDDKKKEAWSHFPSKGQE